MYVYNYSIIFAIRYVEDSLGAILEILAASKSKIDSYFKRFINSMLLIPIKRRDSEGCVVWQRKFLVRLARI